MTIEQIRAELDADPYLEEGYQRQAEKLLADNGFVYVGGKCTCGPEFNEGEYGHDFFCGFAQPQ
jgi:hypothetical protein